MDLILSQENKSELEKIGLTKDWNMDKQAPAKVMLKSGDFFDFATIQISNHPPIGYHVDHFTKIIFIDKVKSIQRSEFELSKIVREKTREAEEKRMGFYPTVLKTSSGKKIIVNGQPLFFKNSKIKGTDLVLANEAWNHEESYIYEKKIEKQVLIIAKK